MVVEISSVWGPQMQLTLIKQRRNYGNILTSLEQALLNAILMPFTILYKIIRYEFKKQIHIFKTLELSSLKLMKCIEIKKARISKW